MKGKIALILFIALLFTGCVTIQSVLNVPEVTADSFSVTSINFDSADILCKIKIHNPNSVSVEFPSAKWELYLNNNSFQTGQVPVGDKIGPFSTAYIQIPLTINYNELYDRYVALLDADTADFHLAASFLFKLPLFGKDTYTVDFNGQLPMNKMPMISLDNILLVTLEPEQVDFVVTAKLNNKNSFDLPLSGVSYRLKINNTQWAMGTVRRQISVAARSEIAIPMNISIKTSDMVSEIYSLILSEKDVYYEFDGKLSVIPGSLGFDLAAIPFNVSGNKRIKL